MLQYCAAVLTQDMDHIRVLWTMADALSTRVAFRTATVSNACVRRASKATANVVEVSSRNTTLQP